MSGRLVVVTNIVEEGRTSSLPFSLFLSLLFLEERIQRDNSEKERERERRF